MANVCLNRIGFFGTPPAISQIKNDMTLQSFGEEEGFYSINCVDSDVRELTIDAESRWSPPVDWLQKLSKDYGVLVECEYEEIGSDIWGKFGFKKGELVFVMELPYLEGKHKSMDWLEFVECEVVGRLDSYDSLEDFLADFTFCYDHEVEYLTDMYLSEK
jgi:hypothetical protein